MWTVHGFDDQKKYFGELVRKNNLAHAYIFSGPEMIGKKVFVHDLFTLANRLSRFGLHDPDFCEIGPGFAKGESKIYIETIRDLKKFLSLKPYRGPYRFILIDDAHLMTIEAANALLKILEEPNQSTIFFLVTSQFEQLPQTIASRCQHISFPAHSHGEVEQFLAKTDLSLTDRKFIASMAGGRLGWAIKMSKPERLKTVKKSISEFHGILSKPISEKLQYAKTLYEKELYSEFVPYWLYWTYAEKNNIANSSQILTCLSELNYLITQPQYNHRILLENTLINLQI